MLHLATPGGNLGACGVESLNDPCESALSGCNFTAFNSNGGNDINAGANSSLVLQLFFNIADYNLLAAVLLMNLN